MFSNTAPHPILTTRATCMQKKNGDSEFPFLSTHQTQASICAQHRLANFQVLTGELPDDK